VAAGFLGFAAMLIAAIIIIVRDKDGKKVAEIEVPPGGKVEIVDNSGSAKTPPKKEPEIKIIAGDPDRRAAEYVLSIGGRVQINDEGQWFKQADLPKEPLTLTGIYLLSNQQLTDAGLALLKDCKGLKLLVLQNTPLTDAGLAHFKDCKHLTHLNLKRTNVTAKSIDELRVALPRCRIEWDGGVIVP
jgi:hypothetical protein